MDAGGFPSRAGALGDQQRAMVRRGTPRRVPGRAPGAVLVACALAAALLPAALSACAWPGATGPDWHERRVILLTGVCMSAVHLPPPPLLPPGLPDLPAAPHLPTYLTCGSDNQPLDARAHALETFGALVGALERLHGSAQTFHASDFRYFSYDPNNLATYTPATTRQSLASAAAALESEFAAWHHAEPRATFDLVGHSLGGVVAALWVAHDATADQLRYVHAVVTLDSPVAGYPQPLYGYIEPYLAPLFGDPSQALSASADAIEQVASAPARWKVGPGHYLSAIYDIGNLRDLVVPAFVATISGADGIIDDLGLGPDSLNHGAVLTSPKALAAVAGVLGTTNGPQLAS